MSASSSSSLSSPSSAQFADFSRIRMLWPDHLGLARGKYVPSRLADRGSGFCVTTFAMAYDRDLIPAPGAYMLDGLKDVHGTIDESTLRPSWEDDRTGVAMTSLALDHEPYPVAARTVLGNAIEAWNDLGYSPKVGIELEGYLMQPVDGEGGAGGWERYANPRSYVYGTGPLGDPTGFVDDVMWSAERCGFPLESVNVEFDESQFEFTLVYDDAMTACDDAFLFRLMVRELAVVRGLDFTFLGKPFPAVSGSGLHTNMSLVDEAGGLALADDADPHGISSLGRRCLAGLVAHHRALTTISAPTVNAYRRLQPGSLAGCWANWGVDHRNVTNRLPADGGSAMRIESRVGDGAMNIHLGVAAVLTAARLGVTGELECPPAYVGDGFEEGGTDVRSATSLDAALDDLEADAAFTEALGADVVANFVANKRHEAERFAATGESIESDELTTFERDHYLPYH